MLTGPMLLALLALSSAPPATDFGIRTIERHGSAAIDRPALPPQAGATGRFSLDRAAGIARQFGRVTSTRRSPERNRLVGGVANSWHLLGRAIDVARSPSVSHAALAGELRRRGYHLIESLDEGDHSHFAFGDGLIAPRRRSSADQIAEVSREADYFRFVLMPQERRARPRPALR